MTETFVSVPGGRLLVADDGAATDPAILLIHAGVADSRSWEALTPHLTAAGYRAIRFDRRGYGRSETEDVEYSNRADVRAILDALGIGRAALVGNSNGGQIAFDLAIESPERVVAVVGVAAGLGGFDIDEDAIPFDQAALFESGDALEAAYEAGGPDAPTTADMVDFDLALWVDGPGQPANRVDPGVRALMGTMDTDHYAPGRVYGRAQPLQPPANDRLADLRCPVLAVAGELDVCDVVPTARHLEANAPDARALVWDDVAHMIGMEVPERLAAAIVEFLAPLPRWS
jgi:pimeloyl-ACP methyl ester carboxylesterase